MCPGGGSLSSLCQRCCGCLGSWRHLVCCRVAVPCPLGFRTIVSCVSGDLNCVELVGISSCFSCVSLEFPVYWSCPKQPQHNTPQQPQPQQQVSAEAEGQACETPTVMHGRGLPAVSRDSVVSSQWLRKEGRSSGVCLAAAACTAALFVTCSMLASWWCGWW